MIGRSLRWLAGGIIALLVLAAGVAGFRPQEPECVRNEPTRPLDLNLASDRTHLREDLDDIRATALRFSGEVSYISKTVPV